MFYDIAQETPLEHAPKLSARLDNHVLLKREDLQEVFSFKLRGAYNKMALLSDAKQAKGVIAASAGNHAQGVALAGRKLGCRTVIVMPVTTPSIKVDAVRAYGAEVFLHGDNYNDAESHAHNIQQNEHLTFVHPYDDPDVIAGQGHDRHGDSPSIVDHSRSYLRTRRWWWAHRRYCILHQATPSVRTDHWSRA